MGLNNPDWKWLVIGALLAWYIVPWVMGKFAELRSRKTVVA